MRKLFFILTFSLIAMSGCKKDKNDDNSSGNVNNQPVAIQIDSFPLSVGHSWKFHTEIHVADSTGVVYQNEYYDNYWTTISDTIINGTPSTKISQLDSNYDGTTHLAFTYYANKPNGLYGMAVENIGSMFYLRSALYTNIPSDLYLQIPNNSKVDTLFVPDSSIWFLKFPSALNEIWHTVKYGTTGSFYQTRMYESYETVTTSLGIFNCLKTKIYFEDNGQPVANGITIYQYFASKGLIEETLFSPLTFSNGSTGTMTRTSKLVQVNF